MRRRLWAPLRVLALLAVLSAACGSSGGGGAPGMVVTTVALGEPQAVLDLAMRDLAFERRSLELASGVVVELKLTNRGTLTHDFTIDRIPVELQPLSFEGRFRDGRSDLHLALDGGKGGAVRLRSNAAGEYTFYCSVAGHRQAGMEGKLVVR